MNKPLPEQVIVTPRRGMLNPNDEDDDREMCTGHIIKGPRGYIFEVSGSSGLFREYESDLRIWMAENGYRHTSDLQRGYLAVKGLHGVWSREGSEHIEIDESANIKSNDVNLFLDTDESLP